MCNCIAEVQKNLEESGSNTMLDIPVRWTRDGKMTKTNTVSIATCKRDDKKREKPTRLIPPYCPFCGKEYESEQK